MKKENVLDKKLLHEGVDRATRCCIVLNDRCCAIQVEGVNGLLTLISMLMENIKDEVPKEVIINAIEIGYMTDKEKCDLLVEMFKKNFEGEE